MFYYAPKGEQGAARVPRNIELRRLAEQRRMERYRADPEYRQSARAYQRAYYRANRERLLERRREIAANRQEEIRAANRARYARNPVARLDYWKGWRARNIERARAYQRAADERRRAAHGSFSADEWLALVASLSGRCAYCGAIGNLEADHRVPLSRGGAGDIANILPACVRCNRRKFNKTEAQFRAILLRETSGMRDPRMAYDILGSSAASSLSWTPPHVATIPGRMSVPIPSTHDTRPPASTTRRAPALTSHGWTPVS